MLIKAGALDDFGDRDELLYQYCTSVADTKQKLTLQNMQRLVDLNLLPDTLIRQIHIYKVTKHLKKFYVFGEYIVPDDQMLEYIERFNASLLKYDADGTHVVLKEWEKFYKKEMEVVKAYIAANHEILLNQVNQIAIQELLDKYAKGDTAYREMEALSYYYSYHELSTQEYKPWLESMEVSNFGDLPEEPIIEWQEGERKVFRLHKIVGTAIGRDKGKGIVGILTPDGFIKVKFYKSQFIRFDKQIKENGITEKSWFSKGTKLMLQGYRDGDTFVVKAYKNSSMKQPILKIVEPGILLEKRLGE